MISENEIKSVLQETNPGLTNQELEELGTAMHSLVDDNCPDGVTLPSDMVEECLSAVRKLKDIYDNKLASPEIEDVVLVNELKQLEWKLKEELRNV